jgi:hypothetical protein
MPARTNPFQKLVLAVERACAPVGARVTESAFLPEPSDGGDRETDILIEHEVGVRRVRIAIECRAHARRQDVGWIDELVGKYRDLGISQITAVSKSGFTDLALQKAARLGIETLSPEEATEKDWHGVLGRLFLRFGGFSSELRQIVIGFAGLTTLPPTVRPLTLEDTIEGSNGESPATVGQTGLQLYDDGARQAVGNFLIEHNLIDFANPQEGVVDDIHIRFAVPPRERFIKFPDGTKFEIGEILLRITARPLFIDPPHSRFKYANTMVTVANLPDQAGTIARAIVLTQTSDGTGQIRVGIESIDESEAFIPKTQVEDPEV